MAVSRASRSSIDVDGIVWRVLAWVGIGLQAGALVLVWLVERWSGVWVIAGFLAVSLLFMLNRRSVPSLIDMLVVAAAAINAGGWVWNWFDALVWFDEVVHAFTSMAVVAAIVHLLCRRYHLASTVAGIAAGAALGLAIGIAWELVEMTFLDLQRVDTTVDLLMDTIGGAAGGWLGHGTASQQRRHP